MSFPSPSRFAILLLFLPPPSISALTHLRASSPHPPPHPIPSVLLARWLVYHWDGCGIKAAPFLSPQPLHCCFSASLPSLILVSSHCGVFNASYHMVAGSSRRCAGAFVGAWQDSCNNACQVSEFFITLMLALADPSSIQPHPPSPFIPNHKLVRSLYWKDSNHKPHGFSDVISGTPSARGC